MLDFSVVIPTYNGAERLPQVLDKLRSQIKLEHITWEIIIVDNNSTDQTKQVVEDWKNNNIVSVEVRYILETKQGAAFARIKGIQEAQGELIGFLDDDNLPESNWMIEGYNFAQSHPQAGAISGQIHGNFEVKPPENFDKIQAFLAIREHGEKPFLFNPDNLQLPPGAALIIRRQAWLDSVSSPPKLTGKLPGLFMQGDDYEPLLYIHKAGWEIWYNPEMHAYHQIPKWRLERGYLLSLAYGCGLATCQLRMINAKSWQKPIIWLRNIFGNLRKIIFYSIKYYQQIETNLVIAFELEFYKGSLWSSFYCLNNVTTKS